MFKFKGYLFESKNLLGATVFCFLFFCFFLGFYIYAVVDKPGSVGAELLSTEGEFLAIAASSQRGIVFVVKKHSDEKLMKFNVIPGATKIQSGFTSSVGRNIVLQHYGRLVVSCRIDGVEFCVSSCVSEYECRMNIYRADVSALGKMVCTMLVLVVICFVAYLIKRKRHY
ncbi:hypothetical protein [Pseudomonas sp. R37(2017)]|uniref:hypothetical protein n=1 Tax=Pseudomonas sp. R37(2017) TaxID=1981685 RepID=UPI000A1D83A7|nr:hypothetical protein [Pseudomonas sp. R37(2017)]